MFFFLQNYKKTGDVEFFKMAAIWRFLNHRKLINDMYENCIDLRNCSNENCTVDHSVNTYEIKYVFFDIRSSYLMDTQALALINCKQVKKKRRKLERNDEFSIYHKAICQRIENCMQSLKSECLPGEPNEEEILLNNIFARTASRIIDDNCRLSELCQENIVKREFLIGNITSNGHVNPKFEFVNKLITNEENSSCVIKWELNDYLIPANSSFLLSNNLNILTELERKYDVIIIDFPWNNKSLKRKHCYYTSSEKKFFKLPITNLANENCLLCVWTTNNSYLINFVKSQLFPHWGVEYITDWHWLKITQYGEPVVSLNNATKKPYENLILGRRTGSIKNEILNNIPKELIFISVPSCFHSHKPLIKDLLKDYIPEKAKCLEIFSRSLCTGWTSFGNEVLKFQQLDLYVKK